MELGASEEFGTQLVETKVPKRKYMRTNDVGFSDDEGNVFIVDSQDNILAINSRTLRRRDIEAEASYSHPSLIEGAGVAFLMKADTGPQRLIILHEIERRTRRRRRRVRKPAATKVRRNSEHTEMSQRLTSANDVQPPHDHLFEPKEVIAAIKDHLARVFGVEPHAVLLVKAGSLPRTSIGEIRGMAMLRPV